MTKKVYAWSLLTIAIIATLAAYNFIERQRHSAILAERLRQVIPVGQHAEVSCAEVAAAQPLVLLALGQSNAGNHGSSSGRVAEPVVLIAEGKCIKAMDPLPGGTGIGGSIWQRLPVLLSANMNSRPIVLSVLAVDTTSIDDWTNSRSPLKTHLASHVEFMRRLGLAPNLVLWQQGEADALMGTGTDDYSKGLDRLAATLNAAGTNVPIILARSTICRSPPNIAIRKAIEATAHGKHQFRLGPDTDTLSDNNLRSGCHLSAEGLDSAAKMWAETIRTEILAGRLASYTSSGSHN